MAFQKTLFHEQVKLHLILRLHLAFSHFKQTEKKNESSFNFQFMTKNPIKLLMLLYFMASTPAFAQNNAELNSEPAAPPNLFSEDVLRLKNWERSRVYAEITMGRYVGFDFHYNILPDLSLGFGFIGADIKQDSLSHINVFSRYFLPNALISHIDWLKMSRVYIEGRGRFNFSPSFTQIENSESAGPKIVYGTPPFLGLEPRLGIESRWGNIITRFSVSVQSLIYEQSPTKIEPDVQLSLGAGLPIFQDNFPESYLLAEKQLAQTNSSPVLQFSSGSSNFEGIQNAAMFVLNHWGMGFYHGNQYVNINDQFIPFETIGLKCRYYFDPIHPGPQGYLEDVTNFGDRTGILARVGLEHRELWGGFFNVSVGAGTQKLKGLSDSYSLTGDFSFNLGYSFSFSHQLNFHKAQKE